MPPPSRYGSPHREHEFRNQAGANLHDILDTIQESMASHGATGIVGLGRKFRIMDDDASGFIDRDEFQKGMSELGVMLTNAQCAMLFSYFDTDHGGNVSYDELLVAIRGKLNPRRKALVDMAYKVLDKNGDGLVTLEDIAMVYDASKHPAVIAGTKQPYEVLGEFMNNFDQEPFDGKVTTEEFEHYYGSISASIDNDDYFELMIRNAWHISGGEGWCANTTNKRVLVTDASGNESVQEIKDDIGVTSDEYAGRLAAQGVAGTIGAFGTAGDA